MKTVPPAFNQKVFNCPICGAYAHMMWLGLYANSRCRPYSVSRCNACAEEVLWAWDDKEDEDHGGHMIHPAVSTAPMPHEDLPDQCKQDYNEAREIISISVRGAGALLRLCLEKLCQHLLGNEKKINENIRILVEKGLPVEIQRTLDFLRVVGNEAVHPGKMAIDDTPEVVFEMFAMINVIVQHQITQPRMIENLYGRIPESARQAIEARDNK